MKWLVLLCLVTSAAAAPSMAPEDVEQYKAFLAKAKPTNGSGPSLDQVMAERPWSSAWENSGKYQGDILLTDQQIEDMVADYSGEGQRTGVTNTRNRWPGNTIIYEFAAGHYNADQMRQVEAAFNLFNTRTCVRFRRRTNELDFVRVTRWDDGCYAHVGYWPGFGAHAFNLAFPGCFNLFIIIHEWLHVVGFNHMHQTYSRDTYVTVHFNNVIAGMQHNFDRFTSSAVTMLNLPYEYASNQHYGRTAFSSNGRDTVVPRFNDHGQMGQLTHVTGWDIQRINRLYNCPGAWSTEVRAEDANTPAYTMEDLMKDIEEAEKAKQEEPQ